MFSQSVQLHNAAVDEQFQQCVYCIVRIGYPGLSQRRPKVYAQPRKRSQSFGAGGKCVAASGQFGCNRGDLPWIGKHLGRSHGLGHMANQPH